MAKRRRQPREAVISILCEQANAPVLYHWYQEQGETSALEQLRSTIAGYSFPDLERSRIVGEFVQRMQDAEKCKLMPVDEVAGPMETELRFQMFEIRFNWEYGTDDLLSLRLFHVEPKKLWRKGVRAVVGLLMFHKDFSQLDVGSELQDAAIQKASVRYFRGKKNNWGLST